MMCNRLAGRGVRRSYVPVERTVSTFLGFQ